MILVLVFVPLLTLIAVHLIYTRHSRTRKDPDH